MNKMENLSDVFIQKSLIGWEDTRDKPVQNYYSQLVCSTNVCLHPQKMKVKCFDRFWGSANTQEAPCHGLACSKQYIILVCFINVYLPVKNQSQTPIHSRDIGDQRIVKSHRLRACQGQAGSKLIDYGCLFH